MHVQRSSPIDPAEREQPMVMAAPDRRRRHLAVALLVVLAVNTAFSLGIYPWLKQQRGDVLQDRDMYEDIARNLVAGQGYAAGTPPHATLRRMPGYPLFLAGVMTLFGDQRAFVILIQLGLLLASAYWVYRLGARDSHLAGLAAVLILGMYPLVMIYSARYYSESLLLFLVTGGLFGLQRIVEIGRWRWALWTGVCLGAAWMTRTTILLWMIPAGWMLGRETRVRHRKRLVVIAVTVTLLCAVPWVVRNYRLTGRVVPGSTWNARSALHGLLLVMDPRAETDARRLDDHFQQALNREMARRLGPIDSPRQEVREDREAVRIYLDTLVSRPGEVVLNWWRGLFRIYFQTSTRAMEWVEAGVNLGLAALALMGLLAVGRPAPDPLRKYLWLLLGVFYLFHSVVYPHVRYLYPALPALAVLAGMGFSRLLARFRPGLFQVLEGVPAPVVDGRE